MFSSVVFTFDGNHDRIAVRENEAQQSTAVMEVYKLFPPLTRRDADEREKISAPHFAHFIIGHIAHTHIGSGRQAGWVKARTTERNI